MPLGDARCMVSLKIALQLGREMAAEARTEAAARSARQYALEREHDRLEAAAHCAAIARSTKTLGCAHNWVGGFEDGRLRCTRIGCDASIDAPKPKSRERVLEEALREMPKRMREHARLARITRDDEQAAAYECAAIDIGHCARYALEWKPQ